MPYLDLRTQGVAGELKPNLVVALKHRWEMLRRYSTPGRAGRWVPPTLIPLMGDRASSLDQLARGHTASSGEECSLAGLQVWIWGKKLQNQWEPLKKEGALKVQMTKQQLPAALQPHGFVQGAGKLRRCWALGEHVCGGAHACDSTHVCSL